MDGQVSLSLFLKWNVIPLVMHTLDIWTIYLRLHFFSCFLLLCLVQLLILCNRLVIFIYVLPQNVMRYCNSFSHLHYVVTNFQMIRSNSKKSLLDWPYIWYNLKILTFNLNVITYNLKMINYNLKVESRVIPYIPKVINQ